METLSQLLDLCEGNPQVRGGSAHKVPVMQSFGVFFDVSLKELLNKQMSWDAVALMWCHCNVIDLFHNNFSPGGTQPEHRKLAHEL